MANWSLRNRGGYYLLRFIHFLEYLAANKAGRTGQRQCRLHDYFSKRKEVKNGDNFMQRMHKSVVREIPQDVSY